MHSFYQYYINIIYSKMVLFLLAISFERGKMFLLGSDLLAPNRASLNSAKNREYFLKEISRY